MAEPPSGCNRADFVRAVDHAIRHRRTRKVQAGTEGCATLFAAAATQTGDQGAFIELLSQAIEVAGWAPFHYPRNEEVAEPWRFHVYAGVALQRYQADLEAAGLLYGKLPKIFAGAGALVQATWLPESDSDRAARDWEHAAAAAAAVQNLLLAAEARGLATYWCSAPNLGDEQAFALGTIPLAERFLGSLFFGMPLSAEEEEQRGWSGKMNRRRASEASAWCRWVGT